MYLLFNIFFPSEEWQSEFLRNRPGVSGLKSTAGLHAHRQVQLVHANQRDTCSVPLKSCRSSVERLLYEQCGERHPNRWTHIGAWLAGCPTSCSFCTFNFHLLDGRSLQHPCRHANSEDKHSHTTQRKKTGSFGSLKGSRWKYTELTKYCNKKL